MNKIYKLLFVFLILVAGCKSSNKNIQHNSQVINNFDMNINSKDGKKLFSIKSPYSQYESNSNIFNLTKTTIYLFNKNEIEYVINSDKSKLSNNKLLELNGNVFINNTIQNGDKLYANSFKWNIKKAEYLLIGNVKFENSTISLSSNKAILNKSKNIIEFFYPVKYIIKEKNNKNKYEINYENAYYNIETKSVSFGTKDERVKSKIYF